MRLHANCRLHPAARRLMQVVSCCGPKGLFFEGCYGSPDRVQCRLLDAEHHLGAVVAAPEWLKVDGFFFIGVSLLMCPSCHIQHASNLEIVVELCLLFSDWE